MLSNLSYQLLQSLATMIGVPMTELADLWLSTQHDYFQPQWEAEKEQHKDHSSLPVTELTQDVILRYGPELDAFQSKLALFYVNCLIRPKEGRLYHKDVSDWEWSNPILARDMKEYLRDDTYRLVLLSNEILTWKVQMIMHVAQELLPPNGKLTILISVNDPFPQSTLFESAYPQLKWADAIVVGETQRDTYIGNLLGMNYCLASSYNPEE
jgi:hypothetical protein